MRLRPTRLTVTRPATTTSPAAPTFNFGGDVTISGVVAHYKFNGNGNNSASGSFNLSAVGTPTYTTGKFGNCVVVDASNYLSGAPTLNIGTGSMSWSCWVRIPDWTLGGQIIFWKDSFKPRLSITHAGSGLGFFASVLVLGADVYSVDGFLNDAVFTGNSWRHLVTVLNRSTNRLNTWVDGVKSLQPWGTGEADTATLGSTNVTGAGDVMIGGEGPNTIQVDSISVFNKALSDAEIGQLWNSGNGRDYTGP